MSDDWQYRVSTHRYRNPANGQFVSQTKLLELHDAFASARAQTMAALASQVAAGTLNVPDWERQMREEVRLAHGGQYLLGRGGRNALSIDDWRRLDDLVRSQMAYLTNFARALADGKLSEAQLAWRSTLYSHSARQAFERGRASAYDLHLPCYPADGGTACKSRCHCHWSFKTTRREIRATWVLGVAEHCDDCRGRAARYHDYVVSRESAA